MTRTKTPPEENDLLASDVTLTRRRGNSKLLVEKRVNQPTTSSKKLIRFRQDIGLSITLQIITISICWQLASA